VRADQPRHFRDDPVGRALRTQPVGHDAGGAVTVGALVVRVVRRHPGRVQPGAAGKVPLHVVRQGREPKRLASGGVEYEQPVSRPDEVVGVPVRLDPRESAALQGCHSVVTGRDWSR
jgi:hypothetical protein